MILLGLEVLSTTVNFALIISNVNYGVLLDNKIWIGYVLKIKLINSRYCLLFNLISFSGGRICGGPLFGLANFMWWCALNGTWGVSFPSLLYVISLFASHYMFTLKTLCISSVGEGFRKNLFVFCFLFSLVLVFYFYCFYCYFSFYIMFQFLCLFSVFV